jgi:PTH1 family peptidyl-tRNA hydrolase
MAVDAWAARHKITAEKKKAAYLYGEGGLSLNGVEARAIVAKPRTYMNLSGDAVGELVHRHHIAKERLIVVYDEMDLPLGRIRIRPDGSAGGHNGMKSIIERLGTQAFPRIRIGVGRPEALGKDAVDYVLEGFTKAEQETLDAVLARACDALDEIIGEGIAGAMNKFNAG